MIYGKRSNGNSHGLVLTKPEVVNFMLDRVGYTCDKNLKDKVVIEPSAGDGAFVIPILERLLKSSEKHSFDFQEALKNILAFELDADIAKVLEMRINEFLSQNDFNMSLHIVKNEDFLLSENIKADLFIGNPPYVRHENIPLKEKEHYRKLFKTFNNRADIFIPFYEKCLTNLSTEGLVSFICSNRWLKSQYGKSLRELVNFGFSLHEIIDLEDAPAFQEEVIAYPAITTIGEKAIDSENRYYSVSHIEKLSLLDKSILPSRLLRVCNPNNWFQSDIADKKYLGFFDKIENQGFKIGIGVATGADKIFISKNFTGEIEEELLLPILMSRDLRNNQFSWSGNFILNPFTKHGQLIDLEKYPKAKRYFEENKPILTKRHIAKKQTKNWYKTIDKIHPHLTKERKIILPDISGNSHIYIDDGKYYPHHNLYFISGNSEESLKVLTSLLMSDLVRNQLLELGNKMNGGYPRWQSQNLKKLSIPIINSIPEMDRRLLIKAYDNSELDEINRIVDNLNYDNFEFSSGQLRLLEPEPEYTTTAKQVAS